VAVDAVGNFVVAWMDEGSDGDGLGVRARRLRADGTPRGADFLVNTYTTGNQLLGLNGKAVASDAAGNVVVTWHGPQGADPVEVFLQRYGGLHPYALQVDPGGNGVWEPAETPVVRPGWFNDNGAAQTVGGVLAGLTGPAGPTYSIPDGTAAYGTVANNTAAACTDCYTVAVSGARPGLHWDATARETLTPDAHGEVKQWTLHVGGSFGDVAPANIFYRFVETLLHKGVTGGCGSGNYCPGTSTTREQMSVFVLVAKEGAAYAPPACGTPVFTDVPASSPFCRWIEELARRGVTGGCAPQRFCPTDPVSREQMAVFVLRTLDANLDPPACTTPIFTDVPADSPFCRWIEELVRRGVVSGCAPQRYCPADPVTREQMAVFLAQTFGLALYGP
jgi:hypothetical protein